MTRPQLLAPDDQQLIRLAIEAELRGPRDCAAPFAGGWAHRSLGAVLWHNTMREEWTQRGTLLARRWFRESSEQAVGAMARHAELEFALIGRILCDASAGLPAARKAGVTDALFLQPDYLAVWFAMRTAKSFDKFALLVRVRWFLMETGYFATSTGFRDGIGWCEPSLVMLFNSFHSSQAEEIARATNELQALHGCVIRAVGLFRDARRKLAEGLKPLERRRMVAA